MIILITGAGSGIGLELVKLFSQNTNNKIYGLYRNPLQHKMLKSIGANVFPIFHDLKSRDFSHILNVLDVDGNLDVLIHSAGVLVKKPFSQITDEEWEGVFDVNFFSIIRLIRVLMPMLGNKAPSHIVNIGSMGGFQGSQKFGEMTAYNSSKSALSGLSESLAEEFKDSQVYVNCLALGAVQTKMFEQAFPYNTAQMQPESVAEYIMHFAINGYRYVNGKTLPISPSTP